MLRKTKKKKQAKKQTKPKYKLTNWTKQPISTNQLANNQKNETNYKPLANQLNNQKRNTSALQNPQSSAHRTEGSDRHLLSTRGLLLKAETFGEPLDGAGGEKKNNKMHVVLSSFGRFLGCFWMV